MDRTAASTLCAWIDRELWLLTAQSDSRRSGLIATFVSQASIAPDLPRMLVGIARQHYTGELIEASGAFALHLLGQENRDWVARFGLRSGRDIDKFESLTVHTGSTGSPLLDGTIGWLDCEVEARMEVGDRTIYLAQVVESQVTCFGPPLTLKQLESAPNELLAEMKRLLHLDSQADAQAIRDWREQHNITPKGQQES